MSTSDCVAFADACFCIGVLPQCPNNYRKYIYGEQLPLLGTMGFPIRGKKCDCANHNH